MRDDLYFERMRRGFTKQEKLFFLDRIDLTAFDCIIDLGSADGTMLKIIDSKLCQRGVYTTSLIGVDNTYPLDTNQFTNPATYLSKMSQLSSESLRDHSTCGKVRIPGYDRVLLILSSVLHELSATELYDVAIFANWAHTVVCRDMFFDPCAKEDEVLLKKVEQKRDRIPKEAYEIYKQCYSRFDHKCLYSKDGDLLSRINAPQTCAWYEALFKSQYVENFEREKNEYYYCNNALTLWKYLTEDAAFTKKKQYYKTHTLLPKKNEFKKSYGITLKYPTHVQWIATD